MKSYDCTHPFETWILKPNEKPSATPLPLHSGITESEVREMQKQLAIVIGQLDDVLRILNIVKDDQPAEQCEIDWGDPN